MPIEIDLIDRRDLAIDIKDFGIIDRWDLGIIDRGYLGIKDTKGIWCVTRVLST